MNQVDGYKFDLINQFISLKSLSLQNVNFITLFTLKLYDLEDLSLGNCKKITFGNEKIFKTKNLSISGCEIVNPKSLLNFQNVENFKYSGDKF